MSRESEVFEGALIALRLAKETGRDDWWGIWFALMAAIDSRYSRHMEKKNINRALRCS